MEKLYGELIMCIIKLFWILFILSVHTSDNLGGFF